MQVLTHEQTFLISAGHLSWHSSFDIAAGGLLGAVVGGLYPFFTVDIPAELLVALISSGPSALMGAGIGCLVGAAFALTRETISSAMREE